MGKKKKYNAPKDPIKAMKKAARDLEMEMGVRFTYNHPHKSKKQYDRKNKDWKKDIQSLNFSPKILIYKANLVFLHKVNAADSTSGDVGFVFSYSPETLYIIMELNMTKRKLVVLFVVKRGALLDYVSETLME